VQSIAADGLEGLDPLHVLELAKHKPDVLLQWLYQNLENPPEKLDEQWIQAIHRGGRRSTGLHIDQEFTLAMQLSRYPVDIETFLFGRHYLQKERREIYPEVLQELKNINNPSGLRIINPYTEGVFTGGIGSAKSTTALYTNAYQLYVLSCFESPHATFGLDTASEIVFAFLAVAGNAADTDYSRFYQMLKESPYFNLEFPYNRRLESEMHFPHRIQVVPQINTIGQNVMGGLIDEVNFGQVIQNSKRSIDGGTYDQTLTVYNGLARRRKSRFLGQGTMPGILCLVSSKRYPGEFTDKKLEEARTDPSIYVYDKRVWDVKPEGTYSGKRFKVFPGSVQRKPVVITPEIEIELSVEEKAALIEVPIEYRKEFTDDMIGSLRDIAGVSTIARHPYFQNVNAVSGCFGQRQSILNLEATDFETSQLQFFAKRIRHPQLPRWAHIDLGVTSDSAGIACGYVPQFVLSPDEIGMMPQVEFDFILRATPPLNGEIKFYKIRKMLMALREAGMNIKWVSFDAFQSVDSIQILRNAGFSTGRQSVDQNAGFYGVLKTAMYANRVKAPQHTVCQTEILRLERDTRTGKIDHPPDGSKDCSDAMAGVVYGLTMRREIWSMHNVPFNQIYQSVKEVQVKTE